MKAAERTLQQILHAADQYVIPVFQRYYVWDKKDWEQLWEDLLVLLEASEVQRRHFLGSIVCVSEPHVPGVVPAYQVIDGQQRLITLSILLCAVRNSAAEKGWSELAAEVEENYLIHRFKKGRERYKVFPRLRDRNSLLALIDHKSATATSQIDAACDYLSDRLHADSILASEESLRNLFTTLVTRVDFVSITLGNENPYKIFKSLNSTGVDLEQGDLIRNHIFMSMPVADQDAFDDDQWRPLERHFLADGKPVLDDNPVLDGKAFTAFFRDVLMRKGIYIGALAVYEAFESDYPITSTKTTELVADLERCAKHYDIIRGKKKHTSKDVDRAIRAIRSLNATTAYPLVLALLDAHETDKLSLSELVESLSAISGFVLRRYVCGKSSRAYGRWFCSACKDIGDNPLANLTAFLKSKGWPNDAEFLPRFQRLNLYEGAYNWAILEGIELSLQADCEPVVLEGCTIEHVMPQSITDDDDGRAWQADLGKDSWREVQAEWLHTPGNLTLVGKDYNIEMRKAPFVAKQPVLVKKSKVYLNDYFKRPELTRWDKEAIMERGWQLAQDASRVWASPPPDEDDTGPSPDDPSQKGRPTVSLSDLVNADLLHVGQKLFMNWKQRVFEGTITASGTLTVFGKTCNSLSDAAVYAMQTAGSTRTTESGWERWKTASGDVLNVLREKYLASRPKP